MKIASLVAVMRRFSFVRETLGPNRGAWVQWFQRFANGQPGDSWCAFAICVVLDICYAGKSPLIKTGSCQVLLIDARRKGFELQPGQVPQPEDLFFYLTDEGTAHHVGVVTVNPPMTGIAGNTSIDGKSSDGTGVFEHAISGRMAFVRLPA